MRRRRTMSRKPAKTQHPSTRKPKNSSPPMAACQASSNLADLQDQVSALTRELAEALDQQMATSEVLRVIKAARDALNLVFETLLANTPRLCQAKFGNLDLREGNSFRIAALH